MKTGTGKAFPTYKALAEWDVAKRGSIIKLPTNISHQPFPVNRWLANQYFERSTMHKEDW
jgi:hypothetical protein